MPPSRFPPIDHQLLVALRRSFPATHIRPDTPHDKIMFEAGQQDVIRVLAKVFDDQQRNAIPEEDDD